MKRLVKMIAVVAAFSGCLLTGTVRAQSTAAGTPVPPTVVDQDKDNIPSELKEIKSLVKNFEAKRDAYVEAQKDLLAKLKGATPEQREAIREQLQDNRQAFLLDLHRFRTELREEIREIKNIVHNDELKRLIDLAHDLEKTGGHHKGN